MAVGDIVPHGIVEKDGLLGDDAHQGSQGIDVDPPQIDPVYSDFSFRGIVESYQQIHQCGLAGSRRTYQGRHFPGCDRETDSRQYLLVAVVAERHVVERHLLFKRLLLDGIRRILDLGLGVEHLIDSLGGSHSLLNVDVQVAYGADGLHQREHGKEEEKKPAGVQSPA